MLPKCLIFGEIWKSITNVDSKNNDENVQKAAFAFEVWQDCAEFCKIQRTPWKQLKIKNIANREKNAEESDSLGVLISPGARPSTLGPACLPQPALGKEANEK